MRYEVARSVKMLDWTAQCEIRWTISQIEMLMLHLTPQVSHSGPEAVTYSADSRR